MGFTLNRARRDYESIREEEISSYEDIPDGDEPPWYTEQVQLLGSLTFEAYLLALRQVISDGLMSWNVKRDHESNLSPIVRYILGEHDDHQMGFFASDIRCLVRAGCEVAPESSEVLQDITSLVDGGYYGEDDDVCQRCIDSLTLGHLENANRIVLTEGSTDAKILKASLHLLYPHLFGYYSFLDFDTSRPPGGAGHLVSLVKGFAAAGIGNRIIAIFDNDAVGRDAQRVLEKLQLPANIAVMRYPDLELLRQYPTLGPSGGTSVDVNGLAASIEMYLGTDVLQRDEGTFVPVQWRGLVESIGHYQGEVLHKRDLQERFDAKTAEAARDSTARNSQDWAGLDSILRMIFVAFNDKD